MSKSILEKGYGLQLPDNYVDMERDEMDYVDGGVITFTTVYATLSFIALCDWLYSSATGVSPTREAVLWIKKKAGDVKPWNAHNPDPWLYQRDMGYNNWYNQNILRQYAR